MVAALRYLSRKYFGQGHLDQDFLGEVTDQFFERQLCRAALRIRARAHLFDRHEH
jgi:hypothetical protein